jgi:DNA-binding winged helix-turn-helix (wHTH) protein
VPLASRTFDLLLALVKSNGHLLTKEELYQSVWADRIVEESNLSVQISAIRKALGESDRGPHYIDTVKGHGYRFVADVKRAATNVMRSFLKAKCFRGSLSSMKK